MKRIYVIVEGPSEREFVSRILAPYFGKKGLLISAISMLKSGGGMGFSNLEHFKNNVKPLLYDKDAPLITTMVDLFRFPVQSNDPNEEAELKKYSLESDISTRLGGLERVLYDAVQKIKPYKDFIPYIQKHEFEALIFSDAKVFNIESAALEKAVEDILATTPCPEDINTTEEGHPAKRLESIFKSNKKKYVKGANAVDFAEMAGIEIILDKCPRFNYWVKILEALASDSIICEIA